MSLLYGKGALDNLPVSKIFAEVISPYVKFVEKHDGDVAEPIRLTVLELRSNFLKKWGPEQSKVVSPQF